MKQKEFFYYIVNNMNNSLLLSFLAKLSINLLVKFISILKKISGMMDLIERELFFVVLVHGWKFWINVQLNMKLKRMTYQGQNTYVVHV